MQRVWSSVVAGGGRGRWTLRRSPHLVPHAGQATYIKPRMPSGGVLRGSPGAFLPRQRHGRGSRMPGLAR